MVDDKERRDIVANLRKSAETHENWEKVSDSLLLDILAADLNYDENNDFEPWLFNYLADLIEQEECKDFL